VRDRINSLDCLVEHAVLWPVSGPDNDLLDIADEPVSCWEGSLEDVWLWL
jgi:hypothetical protein